MAGPSTAVRGGHQTLEVVAAVVGGPKLPSVRFRVQELLPELRDRGLHVTVLWPTWNQRPLDGMRYAFRLVAAARRADVVWLQKVSLPRPLVLTLALIGAPIVFDFDDALYASQGVESAMQPGLRRHRLQVELTVRLASVVVAGNAELAAFARSVGASDVRVVPTSIDDHRYTPSPTPRQSSVVTLGWMGTRPNHRYLDAIGPALRKVCDERPDIEVKVVSDEEYHVPGVQTDWKCWDETDELEDLRSFDVGLMPLADDPWCRGKCAFKAIQYMAVGIPVIASPVGLATEVVDDGVTGILADSPEDWARAISTLAQDDDLRGRMGSEGRRRVSACYSTPKAAESVAAAITAAVSRGSSRRRGLIRNVLHDSVCGVRTLHRRRP